MSRLAGMKGGGFLNNVDGVLVDYEFTDTFPGAEADTDDPQLFAVLTVMEDGKTDPVQTTLRGGSLRFLEIADQHTVSNPEGGAARIWDKSDLYHFLSTVEGSGVADGGIDPTDLDSLSFTSLIGRRMRFIQEKDEARMEARAAAGQNPKRVVEKNGVKKEYDFTRLAVEAVYDTAPVAPKTGSVAGRKTTPASVQRKAASVPTRPVAAKPSVAPKTAAGVAGKKAVSKPAGADAPAEPFDLNTESVRILKEILSKNNGSILRSQIAMLVTKGYTSHPQREVLRKNIFSEAFLTTKQGWTFDQPSQTITIA